MEIIKEGAPDQPSYSVGGGYFNQVPFPKGYDPKEDEWFGGQDLKEPGVRKNGTYHLEKSLNLES